jgi:hypothetical protein
MEDFILKVGDIVTAIDGRQVYDSFSEWVHQNAYEYEANWNELYEPQNGDICEVVAVADHGYDDGIIYGVLRDKERKRVTINIAHIAAMN